MFKLSICIATFKRARFIGETLDSILSQIEPGVELVVVDGASPDDTPEVMSQYVSRYPFIRYFREAENSGIDGDYNKTVSYATGEYCWLMTDDDLLRPGSIRRVLAELEANIDLLMVNAEVRNADFSVLLDKDLFKLPQDRKYVSGDKDELFVETLQGLSFIGSVIIKREVWLSRDRRKYFGTLFVHVGVIFQHPPIENAKAITQPLITIRYGNAMWMPRGFEIWMVMWPDLIWSFEDFPAKAKKRAYSMSKLGKAKKLFFYRAVGGYTLKEYSKFLANRSSGLALPVYWLTARIPPVIANILVSLYWGFLAKERRMAMYELVNSAYATWLTRWAARRSGL